MSKTFKFFKRDIFGQVYEVPDFDQDVEYWEETERLTKKEWEEKYPIRIYGR